MRVACADMGGSEEFEVQNNQSINHATISLFLTIHEPRFKSHQLAVKIQLTQILKTTRREVL